MLGQYDRCGDPDQEIIRLGRLPVAVVRHSRVYAIYTDQLGAPRALTNRKGRVVWHWNPSPFGDVTRRKDDEDDDEAVTFSFNLRFPGQYYDAETGLNYNDFRYYDPSTGRYITSDPIGLDGGLNTYGYVGGNPASNIDPYGLWSITAGYYDLFGGQVVITGSGFSLKSVGARFGVGIGGGVAINPIGGQPDEHAACGGSSSGGSSNSIGVFADGAVATPIPGIAAGYGWSYGGTQNVSPNGTVNWHSYGGADPVVTGGVATGGFDAFGVEGDISAGIELTHYFN